MIINIQSMVSREVALVAPDPAAIIQAEAFIRAYLGRILVDLLEAHRKDAKPDEPELLKLLALSNAQDTMAQAAAVQMNAMLRQPTTDPSPNDEFLRMLAIECEWHEAGFILVYINVAKEHDFVMSNLSTQLH